MGETCGALRRVVTVGTIRLTRKFSPTLISLGDGELRQLTNGDCTMQLTQLTPSVSAQNTHTPIVQIDNGHATTLSTQVADYFGKRHDSVLRDIRNLVKKYLNYVSTILWKRNS